MQGLRVRIAGIVQGVGFRPFVYNLATRHHLKGWVKNTSAGVDIEVDGDEESLNLFLQQLRDEAPPLSRIDEFSASFQAANGFRSLEILHSEAVEGAFQPISPDVAICPDCLRELFDPNDRRYRYPFINCTNCGPRFTIIKDIPYDRPKTTMAAFPMCPDCEREYTNPLDRRFHAQPVACPACGPQVEFERLGVGTLARSEEAIAETCKALANGEIVAVKGLGGFHLGCDATNAQSVTELRNRKLRVDKPFAIMMPAIETVEQHCFVSDSERELLVSSERPIVLLKRKPESNIVREVAPNQDWVGVMLPYTPLHYLLFADQNSQFTALVMTSGNLSEEPIATDNKEARERLATLADAFLMHNRDIHIRCDDSVVRIFTSYQLPDSQQAGLDTSRRDASTAPLAPLSAVGLLDHRTNTYPIRRSRGYSPFPVKLPFEAPQILAAGSELKNTFCITNKNYAFLSHHIGDMENYETLRSFEQGVEHFEKLFRVEPKAIAYDLHPNYLATRYALERAGRENIPAVGVQHHHAHVAACMAEHGLNGRRPVIGMAFDGTGYGEDGAIWGSEILIADYKSYQRRFHLEYFPLPGGDAAIKKPARKAAIEFEALADSAEDGKYSFGLNQDQIQVKSVIEALIQDVESGVPISNISAKFHNGLAECVLEVCLKTRYETGIDEVALSGGVWQNITLLRRTLSLLNQEGFRVYIHGEVPTNDGGLSLGQAVIAAARMRG
jgi:hydrogenase maturation protein HypF